MGLLAMLARAFINTAGLLMLAFDFTSHGEQIERKEVQVIVDNAGAPTTEQLARNPVFPHHCDDQRQRSHAKHGAA